MSSLIRVIGLKMSHGGTCRKCGHSRQQGNHSKCDNFRSGFTYISNSKESTIAELKSMIDIVTRGECDDTPVQYVLRIRQVPE